ncbi:MAG: hypothetical protein EHM58_03315 [Ignavibacteriae bacterium]|nr:MAG: hypothetical protein EHM58_03315 [Ignavibacteriota bacterium]
MEYNKSELSPNLIYEDVENLPDSYFTYVDLQDGPKQFDIPVGVNNYYDIHFAGGTAPVIDIKKDGAEYAKMLNKHSVIRIYGHQLSLKLVHYNTTAKVGYRAW